MPNERPSKWTAFMLSLAVPGSGQLLAGSATALAWFVAVALLVAVLAPLNVDSLSPAFSLLQLPLWLAVSFASAWHARGLLEISPPWPTSPNNRASVDCSGRGRKMHATIRVETTCSPDELWQRLRDVSTILTIDPFHEAVTLMRDPPAAGVDVVLHHNAFGRRFDRFGRILWWREGEGFAVSDLSSRGDDRGFPHIFEYRIEHDTDGKTALHVIVTGRWTSRFVPAVLGRWWIAAVCRYHAMLLRHGL